MALPEAFQEATADDGATAEPCAAPAELSESPRLVTRGETTPPHESLTDAARDSAFVDWLGLTVVPPPGMGLDWALHAVETTFCVPREKWTEKGRGWFGYTSRLDLGHFGLVAYGGETQKGTFHVELDGRGCRCIEDWNAVRLWGEVYKATLTRVDLAHDDFAGSVINIVQALGWWHAGAFVCSGRAPRAEFIDDMGSGHGRTLYVGRRGNGKTVRFYEKGKQLGNPLSAWTRVEVELRNKGRVIPWETVTHPGQYLAGAYPVLLFSTQPNRDCARLARPLRSHTRQWRGTSVCRGERRSTSCAGCIKGTALRSWLDWCVKARQSAWPDWNPRSIT